LVFTTMLYYCIPNVILCYLIGPVTSPLVGIAFIGSMVVAFMVLDFRPAMTSVVALVVSLIVLTVAERFQWIPYAPLMAMDYPVNGRPSIMWVLLWGVYSLSVAVLLVIVFTYIVFRWRERELLLEMLSYTDGLTGITNRRKFMEVFELEVARARRTGSSIALLMCDVDYFKQVNDQYGHKAGDQVLRRIGQVLQNSSRYSTDVPARLGGEEFALLLAETDLTEAMIVAERVLEAMRIESVNTNQGSLQVTMSIGVASQCSEVLDADILMENADKLLYRAKSEGRDRVIDEGADRLCVESV